MTSTPAIVVEDVSKQFRLQKERVDSLKERVLAWKRPKAEEFWALRGVSLEIPEGTTYGLVGHNGSGKSTLLRLMAGIHRPTKGRVQVEGRISALLELGAGFHPELTGRENVYLNAAILGLSRREVDKVFDDIVEFAGIEEFIDTPVKIYSSGMFVRLGFSVAVHVEPDVLLLDEVIAVGDEEFQRRCYDHLFSLARRGVTIVIVSHSLAVLEQMCDRVAWLDHGTLKDEGPVADIGEQYLEQVNRAEEARLAAGHGSASEYEREGSGEVEITRVEFVGRAGASREIAVSGEPVAIRLHYRAHEPIDDAVFGIGVYHQNGVHLAFPNSAWDQAQVGRLQGDGFVDYELERLPLLPGPYILSVAIYHEDVTHAYDHLDRQIPLRVQPGTAKTYLGMIEMDGRWQPAVPARAESA